jgi:putative glutamine amidotransferase
MRPIIGITCGTSDLDSNDNTIPNSYIGAIEDAGGTPIILPLVKKESSFADFIDIMDGLLLSGGVDLDPSFFGEEPQPALGRIDADRDRTEMFLATKALEANIPILGICRGIQLLNVAAGGTLYQDIYSECSNLLKHRQTAPGTHATHVIDIKKGSRLLDIMGQTRIKVNTFHHQAVKKVAPDFIVSAVASDGIVEGIESTKYFAIGVQFHPERMWQNNPPVTALFTALIDAARLYKQE